MRHDLRALLDAHDGVVDRAAIGTLLHHHVDRAISGGHLVRVFPRVWTEPHLVGEPVVRRRAALLHAGSEAALSHTTGLAAWGLAAWGLPVPDPPGLPVPDLPELHVTVPPHRQLRHAAGLRVHRAGDMAQRQAFLRSDLPTLSLERCLTQSWGLLPPGARRAPLIEAVQLRRTQPDRILAAVPAALRGRAELMQLLSLLRAGCHSELEMWGCLRVFDHRSLPRGLRQHPVAVRRGTVYLDLAYVAEMVDVELDGAAFHRDRERDMRRDAALAALGWVVIRLSWQRCHQEPLAVRAELLELLQMRRRQLDR